MAYKHLAEFIKDTCEPNYRATRPYRNSSVGGYLEPCFCIYHKDPFYPLDKKEFFINKF